MTPFTSASIKIFSITCCPYIYYPLIPSLLIHPYQLWLSFVSCFSLFIFYNPPGQFICICFAYKFSSSQPWNFNIYCYIWSFIVYTAPHYNLFIISHFLIRVQRFSSVSSFKNFLNVTFFQPAIISIFHSLLLLLTLLTEVIIANL